MNTWIYLGSIIVAGILFALIPENKLRKYLSIFSFKKFGIRKKKRWNALIDDLGNGFQVLSFLFCLFFWAIPYFEYFYALWLFFTLLCALSRACLIASAFGKGKQAKVKAALVRVFLFYTGCIGGAAALGAFNHGIAYASFPIFLDHIEARRFMDYMYFLTDPTFFFVLLEFILLVTPLMVLWSHFRYMRTERTFRAANIYTFVFKMLLLNVCLFGLSYYGFSFINSVYHVEYTQT